ncbi:MAG: hypothetical protein II070_10725 [Treponema sp.]|nr:hypothetical protein [Treponema sp.]
MAKHPLAAFETEQALRAAFEPAEGVAEDTTKRRKWRKWLFAKKMYFGIGTAPEISSVDGRSLNGLATYDIYGATRGWSEGETSPLDYPAPLV